MPPPVRLRPARSDDAAFLAEMLLAAVNWLPGRTMTMADAMEIPSIAHYVDGWPRPGDIGVVAETAGTPLGAAWARLLPADDPGYGFVAADVPELSIAVKYDQRGRGVGRDLLRELLAVVAAAGHRAVSLSVERDNPAFELYRSEGFAEVGGDEHAATMLHVFE